MPNDRQWLQAEHSGEDDLAETLFAQLVTEILPIEAGPDFVGRTAQAAWRSRTRRRFVKALAGVVAVLSIGFAAFSSMYELRGLAVGLIARGAAVFSHGLVWLLTSASAGVRWWWIAERIGTAVSGTIAARPLSPGRCRRYGDDCPVGDRGVEAVGPRKLRNAGIQGRSDYDISIKEL